MKINVDHTQLFQKKRENIEIHLAKMEPGHNQHALNCVETMNTETSTLRHSRFF